MTEPKKLYLTRAPNWHTSGVGITYIKRRNVLRIGGWCDSYVGIEGQTMGVPEFCEKLGITEKDLKREAQP